jgi:hypothetical protein
MSLFFQTNHKISFDGPDLASCLLFFYNPLFIYNIFKNKWEYLSYDISISRHKCLYHSSYLPANVSFTAIMAGLNNPIKCNNATNVCHFRHVWRQDNYCRVCENGSEIRDYMIQLHEFDYRCVSYFTEGPQWQLPVVQLCTNRFCSTLHINYHNNNC